MNQKCLNCQEPLIDQSNFCYNCGQSKRESTLSIIQILKDTASNIFNIDSRIFQTLKDIYRPSKLTKVYVAGRRKYYVNPIRLFLFFIIALLSIVLLLTNIERSDEMSKILIQDAYAAQKSVEFDSLVSVYTTDQDRAVTDSIRSKLFNSVIESDSEFFGGNLNIGNLRLSDYKISKMDVVNLTPDEIVTKYKVEGFANQLIIKQLVKVANDPSGGIKYALKNFTWVVLLLVIFSSFLLKLFHIRRNIYLIEHLILMLYSHVLLFLILICVSIMEYFGWDIESSLGWAIIVYFVILFLAFYKYYKQSKLKTIVKFTAFNIGYFMLLMFLAIGVSLISLAIY